MTFKLPSFYRVMILSFCLAFSTLPHAESVSVITSMHLNDGDLNKNRLRGIFLMRQQYWPDGQAIRVFVLPDKSPTHKHFSRDTLGYFPYQLRRSWDKSTFTGIGNIPETVQTEEEMIQAIKETPGSIGYISKPEENQEGYYVIQVH